MPSNSILWRRLDRAGHDSARLSEGPAGPIIEGTAVFNESGRPCRLDYRVVCDDIDLSFTPATNLLPIRRTQLAVGSRVVARAAWLRFPDATLEPLDQTYERVAESRYRYESAGGAFVAVLETNAVGFVTRYPGLWQLENAG